MFQFSAALSNMSYAFNHTLNTPVCSSIAIIDPTLILDNIRMAILPHLHHLSNCTTLLVRAFWLHNVRQFRSDTRRIAR